MFRVFLFNLLLIVNLSALVYEDAEDVRVDRWKVVSPKFHGEITNIFDPLKASRVIKLDGNGINTIYQLVFPPNLENIKMDESFLTWEMNYSENFVIFIVVSTIEGKRYLIYTPGDKNSYLQYGLNRLEKGKWQTYSRNLEKDLQVYEKDNRIIEIKSFVIKGSGLLDNIKLSRLKPEEISTTKTESIDVEEDVALPLKNYTDDILPVLKLKGKNPLVLKVGEEYVEAGATAKNRDGSEIDIKITDNIDILTEGEYTVIYIATNKLGNSSVEKRRVVVGKLAKEKIKEDLPTPVEEDDDVEEEKKEEFDIKSVIDEKMKDEKILNDELRDASRPARPGL